MVNSLAMNFTVDESYLLLLLVGNFNHHLLPLVAPCGQSCIFFIRDITLKLEDLYLCLRFIPHTRHFDTILVTKGLTMMAEESVISN